MVTATNWVEELQRKVFEASDPHSEKDGKSSLRDVPVSVVVMNIHRSLAEIPKSCKQKNFLNELEESLLQVARSKHVNWYEFKRASNSWFNDLIKLLREDESSNMRSKQSDDTKGTPDADRLKINELSNSMDELSISQSKRRLDLSVASAYSLDSSDIETGTTNNIMESSKDRETESTSVEIDLKARVQTLNKENANLREELSRAEESIRSLERDARVTQLARNQLSNKYTWLFKESAEQSDALVQAERREEACKQELKKLEKAYMALHKKIDKSEEQKENVACLKAEKEKLVKRNLEYTKQISQFKIKLNEKNTEIKTLQEYNNQLQNDIFELDKHHQENIRYYQGKIKELREQNEELQSKSRNDNDRGFPLTPPPFAKRVNPFVHSTPYLKNQQAQHRNSLFSELQSSSTDLNDSKTENLKHEILIYNQTIADITEEIDEALKLIASSSNESYVPNNWLAGMDNISMFKKKVTTLLNLVTPRGVSHEKPDLLPSQSKNNDTDLISSVKLSLSKLRNKRESSKQSIRQSFSQTPSKISRFSKSVADDSLSEIDMKHVTIRDSTYTLDATTSSTVMDLEQELFELSCTKPDTPHPRQALLQNVEGNSRKKLFCKESSEIEHQKMLEDVQFANIDKWGSISMPVIQKSDFSSIEDHPAKSWSFQAFRANDPVFTSYRCSNDSVSSSSPSPKKSDFSRYRKNTKESIEENKPIIPIKPLTIAPPKLKFPDSSLNQSPAVQGDGNEMEPTPSAKVLEKTSSLGSGLKQKSTILRSSADRSVSRLNGTRNPNVSPRSRKKLILRTSSRSRFDFTRDLVHEN